MKWRLANLGLECLGHAASEFQVKAVGEDLWRSVSEKCRGWATVLFV